MLTTFYCIDCNLWVVRCYRSTQRTTSTLSPWVVRSFRISMTIRGRLSQPITISLSYTVFFLLLPHPKFSHGGLGERAVGFPRVLWSCSTVPAEIEFGVFLLLTLSYSNLMTFVRRWYDHV